MVKREKRRKRTSPSSMEMRVFPSGDRAMQAIFFRFSKGSVRDLLLDTARQLIFSTSHAC